MNRPLVFTQGPKIGQKFGEKFGQIMDDTRTSEIFVRSPSKYAEMCSLISRRGWYQNIGQTENLTGD